MDYLVAGEELYGELGACSQQDAWMAMAFSERVPRQSFVCAIGKQEDEHPSHQRSCCEQGVGTMCSICSYQ